MSLRSVVAATLVIAACVLAPLAVSAVWVHETVYDTDGYVSAVAPLADDPAIQDAIVDRIVATMEPALGALPKVGSGRLQERVDRLVQPALHRALESAATRVVESERFADLWARGNRTGHDAALQWFSGESTVVGADVRDDQLVVSLEPLVTRVAQRVADAGFPALSGERLRQLDPEIVLVDGPLVGPIRTLIRTLDALALALPLLTVACVIGAFVAATDRRRALARLGLGGLLSMGVALVALRIGREELIDWIATTSVSVAASTAFFDALARELRSALIIGAVLGVGLALAARFAGGRGATAQEAPGSVATFTVVHAKGLSASVALAGLAVLALIPSPTLVAALFVGGVVVAGIAGFLVVARAQPSAR